MKAHNRRITRSVMILLLSLVLVMSACSAAPTEETPAVTDNSTPTESPAQPGTPPAQVSAVNKPRLSEGMQALRWENGDWLDVQDADSDTSWYDYKDKRWANARSADGSFWVWIPRFAYKITGQSVDVIFLLDSTDNDVQGQSLPEGYIVHPAFTDQIELGGWDAPISGFWVSKFEAGKEEESLVFKPNVYAYNGVTVGEAYTLAKQLPYTGAFPHLIKNSEWGAVAYLATSAYGRDGEEVSANLTKVNLSADKTTAVTAGGNGIDDLAASAREALEQNVKQSTTANVYGVYDMAGGLWERAAVYIANGNANLLLNGRAMVEDGDPSVSNRYKTVYAWDKAADTNEANYNVNKAFKGDAMFETSTGVGYLSWFGDESSFMFGNAAFLHRGGGTLDKPIVGIFTFSNTHGQAGDPLGFRCAIIVP